MKGLLNFCGVCNIPHSLETFIDNLNASKASYIFTIIQGPVSSSINLLKTYHYKIQKLIFAYCQKSTTIIG